MQSTIDQLNKHIEYLEMFIADLAKDDNAGLWCLRARDLDLIRIPFERFIYGMTRPAMYGTCPDEGRDTDWMPDASMTEYPYFGVYYRPLTEDEQYRYEMRPYSANAYKYQIGETVLTENGHIGKVIAHARNWLYTVEITIIAKGSFVDTYREKELQSAPDVINPKRRDSDD